jgi:hypothetical protein
MRALVLIALLAACAVKANTPTTQTSECVWSVPEASYQRFLVYHAPDGSVIGRSAPAGRCQPR